MFRIDDFSRICQVSTRTLDHWASIDLLQPACIEDKSGLTYYDIDQIAIVNRITALQVLGLNLHQIQAVLDGAISAEELRGMYRLKQAELTQQIEGLRAQLAMVEARMETVDAVDAPPDYDVYLKRAETQPFVSIRTYFATMVDLVDTMRTMHDQARRELGHGSWDFVAIFHDGQVKDQNADIEVGFAMRAVRPDLPTRISMPDERRLQATTLPGAHLMVCTMHRGSWATLSEGYQALGRWISGRGYEIAGPGREVFLHFDHDQPDRAVTELQIPVRQVRSGQARAI